MALFCSCTVLYKDTKKYKYKKKHLWDVAWFCLLYFSCILIIVIMLSKFRSIQKALAQNCNLLNTIYFSSSDSKCLQDKIFTHIFFSGKKVLGAGT